MASIKDLRKRISSVKNTQQTTKAMKMVSAAKLRRSQEAIVAHRPYSLQIDRLIKIVSLGVSEWGRVVAPPPQTGSRLLLVLVTSDRGLCGGFNASIIKLANLFIKEQGARFGSIQLGFVGRKALDYFKNRGVQPFVYEEFGRKANYGTAKKISESLLSRFLNNEFDEVRFVYNEFKNAITQKPVVEPFLPVVADATQRESMPATETLLFKPSRGILLEKLLEKHFSIQAFRVLLESQASEHGARMTSMENATRNAGEMIQKLALQYNKQRQANITKELLEIISGSESQKG